jgi:hypothetical protein
MIWLASDITAKKIIRLGPCEVYQYKQRPANLTTSDM